MYLLGTLHIIEAYPFRFILKQVVYFPQCLTRYSTFEPVVSFPAHKVPSDKNGSTLKKLTSFKIIPFFRREHVVIELHSLKVY